MGNSERNPNYWGSMSSSSASPQQPGPVPPADDDAAQQQVPFSSGSEGDAHQTARQPYGGQAYPYSQRPTYRSGKDHVAAGLLAIFLGALGIHKFYLGYNSVGFIMLGVTILGSIFSFGLAGLVMGVIGIVEGVIYLTTDQQTFDRTYVYNIREWF